MKKNMKKGVIDQILILLLSFTTFATLFYMVINYYLAVKVIDVSETLSNYGVRIKALGEENSVVIEKLNNIKGQYFKKITEDDLNCTEDEDNNTYQVIFYTTLSGFKNQFLSSERIYVKTATFNEVDSSTIKCYLTLDGNISD